MAHEQNVSSRVEELEFDIEPKNIDAQFTQTRQLEKIQQDLKEAYEKIRQMYETQLSLLEQIDVLTEKENFDKHQAEMASIRREKNRLESEFVALQKDNETIFEKKEKLADDILVMKHNNERMANEIGKISNKLMKRDNELKEMSDKLDATEHDLTLARDIALKYKQLFFDLQNTHDELVAEKADKLLDQCATKLCYSNASAQTDECLNDANEELMDVKQQEIEFFRTENELLSKRLSDLNAKHTTVLNANQTLIDEKEKLTIELNALKVQSESSQKKLAHKDEENTMVIEHVSPKPIKMASEKCPSDAGLPTNAKAIAGMSNGNQTEGQARPSAHKSTTAKRTSKHSLNTSRKLHRKKHKRSMKSDRRAKKSKSTIAATPKPRPIKWCCNICSATFNQQQLVKAHLQHAHHYATNRLIYQFDCTLCRYSNDLVSNIKSHMSTAHAENDLSHVKCNYKRMAMF